MPWSGIDLKWHGDELRPNNRSKRPRVRLEPDEKWSGMWRVVLPDESRSDMFNRARAKEHAKAMLLGLLNVRADATSAPLQH
jgi:hypothetical protein